jgi:uncharacterized protein (TIGR03382 family)
MQRRVFLGLLFSLAAPVLSASLVRPSAAHDESPPLFLIPPAAEGVREEHEPLRFRKPAPRAQPAIDPVLQSSIPPLRMPSPANQFDGVAESVNAPTLLMPPDTDGDVGPNHYVGIVNSGFAVWNKSGALIFGPVLTNTLWTGFPNSRCATTNDGDGVVLYDVLADRWFVTQFSVTGSDGSSVPYEQCVAVSKTGDPTGQWYRYSFPYSQFNDYGKFGVWSDAYYATYNMFTSAKGGYAGAQFCAFDRASMLAGRAATQQCFSPSPATSFGGIIPADLDGTTPPPLGAPNFLVGYDVGVVQLFKLHVDWATPANSALSGPVNLAVAAFNQPCNGTGATCVPQPGTSQQLDTLGDRMMVRAAYRNFGTYESLVVNHTVAAGTSTGVRWYEIRGLSSTPTLAQQGTYAPDSSFRWMGSIAQDRMGNMALGFSLSSASLKPGLAWTGHQASDSNGVMGQGESAVFTGSGVQQQGGTQSRWGDYSSMAIDPTDDCTFWFTSEYIPSNGAFNWHTRVANFKFPGCVNDFSLSALPASQTISAGSTAAINVGTSGTAGTIALFAANLPQGVTGAFNPVSVAAGQGSVLTLTAAANAPTANGAPIVITGSAASGSRSILPQPLVTIVADDFSISLSPASSALSRGAATTYAVSTALVSGAARSIALSASGLPSGVTASFSPASISAGQSSTLTLTASSSAALGTATFSATGVSSAATHSASASVTVAPSDFSLVVTPFHSAVMPGASATYSVQTAATSGSPQSVALSATGLPAAVTASFAPSTVTAGGSSTMTLAASTGAAYGTTGFSVQGTGSSATHSAAAELTVGDDFSLTAGSASGALRWGGSVTLAVNTFVTSGVAQSVALSAQTPSGVTASLSPASVNAGQSSTLTLTASGTPPGGALSFTVNGTGPAGVRSAAGSVTVADDFSLGISPSSASLPAQGRVSYSVTTAVTSGSPEPIALSVSGLPAGVSGSFSPASISAGALATLTLAGSPSAALGSSSFNITGTSSSASHFASASVTVVSDFSLALTPATRSIPSGSSAAYAITTAVTAGPAQSLSLSVSGLPAGLSAQISPAALTAGSPATLTVTAAADSAGGSFPFTLVASGASASHSVNGNAAVPDDFTITASPAAAVLRVGSSVSVSLSTARTSGTARAVALSASSTAGLSTAFDSRSVTAGQTATLTVSAAADATAGAANLTITAIEGGTSHTAGLVFTVLTHPTARIDSPSAGASLTGVVTVAASGTASAGTSLARIEVRADDVLVGSSTSSPATFQWNTVPLSNGTHVLTAKAFDAAGDSAASAPVSVTLANPHPPAVAMISPQPGDTLSGTIGLSASANGQDGAAIVSVDFLVDGAVVGSAAQAPFTARWDSRGTSNGAHSLSAAATDSRGLGSGSAAVLVQVTNKKGCGCSSDGGGWEALGLAGLLALVRRRRRLR